MTKYINAVTLLILALVGPTIAGTTPDNVDLVFPSPSPDLKEIVGVSPVIFTGTVVGMRYGTHEGSEQPYTFVTFSGIKMIREDSKHPTATDGNTLEISYIGGVRESDMHFIEVSYQPSFELGERYLVFLRGGGWRFNPVAGGRLGVFRLHGAVEDDPVILDMHGHPIAAFKDGRPIYSNPRKMDENAPVKEALGREEPLTKEQLERASRQDRPLTAQDIEIKEKEFATKERELEVNPRPEYDKPITPQDRWDQVLKLSELAQLIERYATETRGKYQKFERIHARPVPPKKEIGTSAPKKVK